jgi:hypothetical protein
MDRDLRSPHFRNRALYLDESGDLYNGDSAIAQCAPFSSVVCHLLLFPTAQRADRSTGVVQ